MEQKKYITLREAAKISGYAPDYIGQLIRSGKLPGKEVYCNTAWLTTEEAIASYKKDRKKEGKITPLLRIWRQRALSETKISGLARIAGIVFVIFLAMLAIALGYALLKGRGEIKKLEELQKQDEFLKANILDIAL